MSDRAPIRIAVIGAGVAGCLVVHGLAGEADVEIFCIEKGPEANVLAGTGLNVGPNALKILKECNPVLEAALRAEGVSFPWETWTAGLTDGTVFLDLNLLQVADNTGIRIRWAELYRQLRSPIAAYIRYSTTVVEMGYMDDFAQSPLYLVIEDQQTGDRQRIDHLDLIVGGDGRYSQVRTTFIDKPEPKHLGVCIYRLLVPNSPDDIIDDYQQWFHNGHRLLAFAIPGNEVYIAGSFPLSEGLEIPEEAKTPAYLRTAYEPPSGYSEVCQFLVSSICANIDQIHWARIQEIDAAFGDQRGHVVCLGDSSHAMFPTLGQGATQAFEDGCFMAAHLKQWLANARQKGERIHIPAFVASVEAIRRDRVQFAQQFSREASDALLAGSDPVVALVRKTQPTVLNQLRKLYRDTPDVGLALKR